MLSLSLKKNNLRKRKSLSLTAEPLVRDEKQIVWKYSWNVQSMLCITVVKTSVREYDFCLLSHGTRMKGEGSTGTLCMLKNNQNKKMIRSFRLRSSCTYHRTAGCFYTRRFSSVPFLCKTFSWWEKELPPHWKGLLCVLSSDDSLKPTESERKCSVLVPLSKACFSQPRLPNQSMGILFWP